MTPPHAAARRRAALDELAALLNLPTVGRALDEIDDDDLRTLLRRAAARVRQLAADADEAKVVAIGSVGACIAPPLSPSRRGG